MTLMDIGHHNKGLQAEVARGESVFLALPADWNAGYVE